MKRASGVLMHISSLPGDYSIGGFSASAKRFVDFLCDCGFTYWQTLPFTMVDSYNSPYQSYSAFAGNYYFIDLEKLYADKLLTRDELEGARSYNNYSCEFDRLRDERLALLCKASKRSGAELKEKIKDFIDQTPEIEEVCRFMAIRENNGGRPWYEWENEEYDEDCLFMWQFIQYTFFTQWAEIKSHANSKGIKIIGDIPIYVALDSCDVWANREQFDLDKNGEPRSLAGCPPDFFSEDGQFWGNPLYNWAQMKKDGYSWWKKRISHNLKMFDGVRLDHFRGFDTYWSIPADAETAKEGKWKKGPGRSFIDTIKGVAGESLIIAEDLGEPSESVTKLLEYSGFPGMKIFMFGFLGDDNSDHLIHNHKKNSVVYTGTHDNNTMLGFVFESNEYNRRRLFDYCGYPYQNWNCTEAYDAILKTLLSSVADTVIIPLQDILYYGADTRMNTPGEAEGNWEFRITQAQIDSIDRAKLAYFNKLYAR